MRLGLLADIHEEVEFLDACIRALRERSVDRFVNLGDTFERGPRLAETVERLTPLNSVGVWGNHDFGLCRDVSPAVRSRYGPEVLAYFGSLQSRIEIEACLFQHIEPHLDPECLEDLWSYGGEGRLSPAEAFGSVPHRRVFIGHLHRWKAWSPKGQIDWDGSRPLSLSRHERALVVVHAVQQGHCALYDTDRDILEPIRVA